MIKRIDIQKEKKTKNLGLKVQPTLFELMQQDADAQYTSMNNWVSKIAIEYFIRKGKIKI